MKLIFKVKPCMPFTMYMLKASSYTHDLNDFTEVDIEWTSGKSCSFIGILIAKVTRYFLIQFCALEKGGYQLLYLPHLFQLHGEQSCQFYSRFLLLCEVHVMVKITPNPAVGMTNWPRPIGTAHAPGLQGWLHGFNLGQSAGNVFSGVLRKKFSYFLNRAPLNNVLSCSL